MLNFVFTMKTINPCLWFDRQAEEAINHYVSIFPNSKIIYMDRYDEMMSKTANMPVGTVMSIAFQLDGNDFMAINGGPVFKLTPAISFMIYCENQEEIDHFWDKLGEGGKPGQCGWLEDKYGVSWQVVPTALGDMMINKDPAKTKRVAEAMLKMNKIVIKDLEQAYQG